jgi:hypothetical protein
LDATSLIDKFKSLFEISTLNEEKLMNEIKKQLIKDEAEAILVTICILFILEEYYNQIKNDWEELGNKARIALN